MEGAYIWEQVCACGDPRGYVRELNDQELCKLRNEVTHLMKRNNHSAGVPAVVLGLVELEAAERFFSPRINTD